MVAAWVKNITTFSKEKEGSSNGPERAIRIPITLISGGRGKC